MNDFYPYPRSRPRRVDGGIRARSARGSIGTSWWSRRFVDVLESFALGSRMTRGRSYARAGQVIELAVSPGRVTSSVQGSRARPYRVTIGLAVFPERVWSEAESRLAGQALFSARLLAGEVPPELEQVFAEAGVSLFPRGVRELEMRCSCPDSAVPCKHLAATFYLLAEAFDTDPFQILHWRGRSRDALLGRLRLVRSGTDGDDAGIAAEAGGSGNSKADGSDSEVPGSGAGLALVDLHEVPLASCVDRFWLAPQPLPARPGTYDTDTELLLRQLPVPGPELGGSLLVALLREGYQQLCEQRSEVER